MVFTAAMTDTPLEALEDSMIHVVQLTRKIGRFAAASSKLADGSFLFGAVDCALCTHNYADFHHRGHR